jgi:hypothetical protein
LALIKSLRKRSRKIHEKLGWAFSSPSTKERRKRKASHRHRYEEELQKFKEMGGIVTHSFPILSDYEDQAGTASGHYFHQDLLVASLIHRDNPQRHIDIGSRIDGFVAHVAAFRPIEVMDVRDLSETGHANISFIKANLMREDNANREIADSISCLHALEHFGLGRYGDPLDPDGHIKGFRNIVNMLRKEGKLYISFPIANSNELHFNAHRVFHPQEILKWVLPADGLHLERFDYVDDAGKLHQNIDLASGNLNLRYGCGIYTFKKSTPLA